MHGGNNGTAQRNSNSKKITLLKDAWKHAKIILKQPQSISTFWRSCSPFFFSLSLSLHKMSGNVQHQNDTMCCMDMGKYEYANKVHVLHGNGAHRNARAITTTVTYFTSSNATYTLCQLPVKSLHNTAVWWVYVYRLCFNEQRETKIASNVLLVVGSDSLLQNPEPIDCDFHRNDWLWMLVHITQTYVMLECAYAQCTHLRKIRLRILLVMVRMFKVYTGFRTHIRCKFANDTLFSENCMQLSTFGFSCDSQYTHVTYAICVQY